MLLSDRGAIVCIGFMGAGKSTAAGSSAQALGWPVFDVDAEIERRTGKTIERLFAQDGEAAFRAVEERVTLELLESAKPGVLALGGGAIVHPRVREALGGHLVIWLDVPLGTAWERVEGTGRPLARDRSAFDRLWAEREPLYAAAADVTVPGERACRMGPVLEALGGLPSGAKVLWAASDSGDYAAYIADGLLTRAGYWPSQIPGRRFLITDSNVGALHGGRLEPLAGRVTITPGERSKTVAQAEAVWSALADAGMTRADVVAALGGGVVGDLAGFCAATYQRGVRYVQVPTTLVAQVDSAYGGKTGVDLPEAKNYVGAYHLPSAVIVDPAVLATLPAAERAAGYAEVLKTALIAGGELWESVRAGADPTAPELVIACARAKLRVVAQDERDTGARQVLNLGHTVGHAIEAVTAYARYRHGEAVGLGLLVALRLSGQPGLRQQVAGLLEAHGLPTRLDGVDPDAVVTVTGRDKKRMGNGPVPFVLLEGPGAPRAGCPVTQRELVAAVRELTA
jgi:shikimate kinase/3-dehydroquinate synthase